MVLPLPNLSFQVPNHETERLPFAAWKAQVPLPLDR
jgi:hypothetical protein